jgi:hypothetical protein
MKKKTEKNIHVIPRSEGWAVRSEGRDRITSSHNTQNDAIDAARNIARSKRGEVVIHGRDGRIRERDSYRSDPLPPKSERKVLFPNVSNTNRATTIREAVKDVLRVSQTRDAVKLGDKTRK